MVTVGKIYIICLFPASYAMTRPNRRQVLGTLGSALTMGLAGCPQGGDGGGEEATPTPTAEPTPTPSSDHINAGYRARATACDNTYHPSSVGVLPLSSAIVKAKRL